MDVLLITLLGETKKVLEGKKLFQSTVLVDEDGHYMVFLSWLDGHSVSTSNIMQQRKD